MTDSIVHDPESSDCLCFRCKIKTIQVSPQATPSRTRRLQKGLKEGNSWEKGIVRDGRGMPHLNPGTLEPVPIKTYVEKRSEIEEGYRKMKQSPSQEE